MLTNSYRLCPVTDAPCHSSECVSTCRHPATAAPRAGKLCPIDRHRCASQDCYLNHNFHIICTAALDRATRSALRKLAKLNATPFKCFLDTVRHQSSSGRLNGASPQFLGMVRDRYRIEIVNQHSAKIGTRSSPETPGGSSWMST